MFLSAIHFVVLFALFTTQTFTAATLDKRQASEDILYPWKVERQSYAPWNLVALAWGGPFGPVLPSVTSPEEHDVYVYENNSGVGVDIYIIAPYVYNMEGPELEGRLSFWQDLPLSPTANLKDPHFRKCMANLAAGKRAGVAKNANIIQVYAPYLLDLYLWGGVRRDPTGSELAAHNEAQYQLAKLLLNITDDHIWKDNHEDDYPEFRGSVVLMAFEYIALNYSVSLIKVLKRVAADGVLVVAAAGDQGAELENDKFRTDKPYSPCRLPGVVCVGGVNRTLGIAITSERLIEAGWSPEVSNVGDPVSMWAPAGDILCPLADHEPVPPLAVGVTVNGSTYLMGRGTGLAAAQVAGIAAGMLTYLDTIEESPRYNTFTLRKHLFGNAKYDRARIPKSSREGSQDGRNMLANTGIRSREASGIPFSDGSDLYQFLLSKEKYPFEPQSSDEHGDNRIQLTEFGDGVHCFPESQAHFRVLWKEAVNVHLNLLFEIGHMNIFEHKRPVNKPVPCHEQACVYLAYSSRVVKTYTLIHDVKPLARYVRLIMLKCRDKVDYDPEDGRFDEEDANKDGKIVLTGGYAFPAEYPGMMIRLQGWRGDIMEDDELDGISPTLVVPP